MILPMDEREILEAVAAGRMSPEEAEQSLRGAGPTPTAQDGAFEVRVTATARAVRIIGDPTVTEANVEGRHRAERIGDTLTIDGSAQPGEDVGFSFEGRGGWHRQWRQWRQFAEPMVVRVNPTVPVHAEVSAGSLTVQGVTGPLSVVVAAGSARLDDVSGPFDVDTHAGTVRISGRIEAHESRIRCEAGAVSLHLRPGSSATIRARAEMGRIKIVGRPAGDPAADGYRVATIGGGTASVQVDATMGSVEIFSDEWAEARV